MEPLTRIRRLDLDLPADQPLSPEEVAEMNAHLAFLRRFKDALRLSLNAAEDLLINGARPPSDRGTCRHLLSKVETAAVQKALQREPLKSDLGQRARFMGGVVRIKADLTLLLEYLEALTAVADRREAAQAFALTVDRIDFASASNAQVAKLLSVTKATFSAHDRVQALFGLLGSETFRDALARAREQLETDVRAQLDPLIAAHRVLVQGERPPRDDEDRSALDSGLSELLSAPPAILRSYDESVRARLAQLALEDQIDDPTARAATRKLLDTLPAKNEDYTAIRVARAEQLLRAGDDEPARALIKQLASRDHPWAKRCNEALAWRQVGRVTVSGDNKDDGRLRRGFWLDGASFAWVRTAPADQAGRLTTEARRQSELQMQGVAPVLAHGMAKNGKVFVAVPALGRPLEPRGKPPALTDALRTALEGVQLLTTLARAGLELPDVDRTRFLWSTNAPLLASFAGVRASDPAKAAMTHAPLAATWCKAILSTQEGLRHDLPRPLLKTIQRRVPLPILARALTEQLARRL